MKARNFAANLLSLAQRYGISGAQEPFTKRCVEAMIKERKITSRSFVLMSEAIALGTPPQAVDSQNLQVKK